MKSVSKDINLKLSVEMMTSKGSVSTLGLVVKMGIITHYFETSI